MRRLGVALASLIALCAFAPAAAQGSFGFAEVDMTFEGPGGSAAMQAGSHPFAVKSRIVFNTNVLEEPEGAPKDVVVDLPPGFVGDPRAVPRCSTALG